MKNLVLCAVVMALISCSHNPYSNFLEVKVGQDKEEVLTTLGSPLRSRRSDGKDIWTYRFYQDKKYVYKEITFEKQVVTLIEDAKQTKIEEIEKKEKQIEDAIRAEQPRILQKKSTAKSNNTDFLDQSSQPDSSKFEPVE
jgi:outer membrane protein assembly factor BamE (lipoprotein component of BamABCDE complex)